jgi:hypothetical protein
MHELHRQRGTGAGVSLALDVLVPPGLGAAVPPVDLSLEGAAGRATVRPDTDPRVSADAVRSTRPAAPEALVEARFGGGGGRVPGLSDRGGEPGG